GDKKIRKRACPRGARERAPLPEVRDPHDAAQAATAPCRACFVASPSATRGVVPSAGKVRSFNPPPRVKRGQSAQSEAADVSRRCPNAAKHTNHSSHLMPVHRSLLWT